ncbi:protein serine/threonine phosphatase 2C [Hymenopellis radicata]|nr:protein serine/threonine phosphatase 2C [Hymenopellis radicata]
MVIDEVMLRGGNDEDRVAVLHFKHGTLISLFDGHCGYESAAYAADTLPQLLADHITQNIDKQDIPTMMTEVIESFDISLLDKFTVLFDKDEDFSDEKWHGDAAEGFIFHKHLGIKGDAKFHAARCAVTGTTAVIGFITKDRKHVWVASLGDSDAVLARRSEDGICRLTMLSARHDPESEEEKKRLASEHPNEELPIWNGALLGVLRVTRALGDYQLKAPLNMAGRGMQWVYPALLGYQVVDEWATKGHVSPPYMSRTPEIRHADIMDGDLLIFASDGLRHSLPSQIEADEQWKVMLGLVNGSADPRLGHQCVLSSNVADGLVQNVLFGSDEEKMIKVIDGPTYRDDISVVVIKFVEVV